MSRHAGTAPAEAGLGSRIRQYLTFTLDGELFAIGISQIKEIIEYGALTSVPMMPSFIRGVINLRGAVVPVLDLQARFGRAASTVSRRSCVVILEIEAEGDSQQLGVLVDSVSEVLELADSSIEPAPSFGAAVRPDFIEGMGKINGRFVIVLSLARVLSTQELAAALDAAPAAALV